MNIAEISLLIHTLYLYVLKNIFGSCIVYDIDSCGHLIFNIGFEYEIVVIFIRPFWKCQINAFERGTKENVKMNVFM